MENIIHRQKNGNAHLEWNTRYRMERCKIPNLREEWNGGTRTSTRSAASVQSEDVSGSAVRCFPQRNPTKKRCSFDLNPWTDLMHMIAILWDAHQETWHYPVQKLCSCWHNPSISTRNKQSRKQKTKTKPKQTKTKIKTKQNKTKQNKTKPIYLCVPRECIGHVSQHKILFWL